MYHNMLVHNYAIHQFKTAFDAQVDDMRTEYTQRLQALKNE